MILELFLNTQMIWMMFNKTFFVFDDMVIDMLNNKKLNPIAGEIEN